MHLHNQPSYVYVIITHLVCRESVGAHDPQAYQGPCPSQTREAVHSDYPRLSLAYAEKPEETYACVCVWFVWVLSCLYVFQRLRYVRAFRHVHVFGY